MSSQGLDPIFVLAALACVVLGAACDIRTRRIPNWLAGTSIALGLALHLGLQGWTALGHGSPSWRHQRRSLPAVLHSHPRAALPVEEHKPFCDGVDRHRDADHRQSLGRPGEAVRSTELGDTTGQLKNFDHDLQKGSFGSAMTVENEQGTVDEG